MESELPTRRDQRRDAIIAAAREAFFRNGYAGTAMSSVAAELGGSKTTLWSYFPSKQDLFTAVIDDLVERYGEALQTALTPGADMAVTLRRFAIALMHTVLSPPIVAMHRLVMGEAGRFPELGQLLHARGPGRGKARLAEFFESQIGLGRMRRTNTMQAAEQFSSLCQSGCVQRHMLGDQHVPNAKEIAADVDAALDTFLRAYAADRHLDENSDAVPTDSK